jgi:hypothetical protein
VGVEQVRRAVQRHGGLASAGAALHDEHAVERRPDHPVLLGLDGLDDVPHPAGAGGGHRGEQGGLAGQSHVPFVVRGIKIQHLVVEVDHRAQPGADVAPPTHAVRGRGGRQVERPGRGGPPVDQQRPVVPGVVEQADAADVAALVSALSRGEVEVDAAEAQAVLDGAELRQLLGVEGDPAFPLGSCLRRAAGLPQQLGQPLRRLRAHAVEALVEGSDVLLLAKNFGGVP